MNSNMAASLLFILSTLLPSVLAVKDYLPPDHAVPEMLIIPPNVTIMTPRSKKPQFENQLFDFGSPQTGFSELKRVLERQSTCSTGYGACSNDPGICCPVGGRCCGDGKCCGAGRWCYGGGCCLLTQNGCDDQGCCDKGENCCRGGSCCASGNNCVIISGKLGCCPVGQTCTPPPTCTDSGYSPCEDDTFCCPTGFTCYRDNLDNPKCRDPNPPAPSTTSTPQPPSTTFSPPPPPTTSTEEEESTFVPPPQTSTAVVSVTSIRTVTQVQTQIQTQTQTFVASSTPAPSITRASSTTHSTSTRSVETGAAFSSSNTTTTNVGAIAGGVAAGVVAIIILVAILIFWRRRQSQQPAIPTTAPITAPPDRPYSDTGAMPPTPGTGDPFLTPMAQNQNLGVSYFNDGTSGTNSASQYSGLPEPQYSDNAGGMGMGVGGAAAAAMAMPTPRRDSHTPRPLPMSVVHSNSNYASGNNMVGSGSPRPWSGYAAGPPSSGLNPGAYMPQPEPQLSGWSNPTSSANVGYTPYAGGAASSGYTPGQVETASTIYQPSSSHGGYDESLMARSPPPGSPPPDVYGGMASPSAGGQGSRLPGGAAPPNMYAPGEKQVYRPY